VCDPECAFGLMFTSLQILALKEVALGIAQRLRGVQKAVLGEKEISTLATAQDTCAFQDVGLGGERSKGREAALLKKPRLSLDELNVRATVCCEWWHDP
jgi:hypothetical protein